MTSVASAGTTDRIAARTLFNVLRAGSGTAARYSSTVLGTALPFASEPRLADALAFFIRTMITGDWEAHPLKTAKGWATDQPSSGTMIRTDAMRQGSPTLQSTKGGIACYCLSYTAVLLYFLPCASVPLIVTVRLLPSAATTTWAVRTTSPPFLDVT